MPKEEQQQPSIVQNFSASQNTNSQINQGTVNNPTLINHGDSTAIFEKLAALLQQTAANNDIDIDSDELDKLTDDLQAAYDDDATTEETAKPLIERFKEFISRYTDRLIPLAGKAALGLLAGAVSANPLLSMAVIVLQDAVDE